MCYSTNDRPPEPPGNGQTASGEEIELSAKDGNRFAAYIARPTGSTGLVEAQLLIFPDVRGLHGFYKDLAMRFAERGITALAIDYFGRTAGIGQRDDSFEYMPHVQQMQLETFLADTNAALSYLREGAGSGRATFSLGFCMGGGLSLMAGTQDFSLAGVIAFYSGFSRTYGDKNVLQWTDQSRYPVLGLYGGADQGIPLSMLDELDRQLDKAGVEHDIVVYPGAPHSFFDRKQQEFARESADAWQRVLDFISAHSGSLD